MHWIIKLILSGVAINVIVIVLCIVLFIRAWPEVTAVFRMLGRR